MYSFLKKVIWVCLLIVPFVALYVAGGSSWDPLTSGTSGFFFPFISGKNFIFRFLVELSFFSWILVALKEPQYRINLKKAPLVVAFGIFLIILFVADMSGIDPFKSFWSDFERMEGFVGMAHLFAYFVVLTAMLHTLADYTRMWRYFVFSNIAVLLVGFGQLFGAKAFFFASLFPTLSAKFSAAFPIHMSDSRLDSTLGNSEYFAIFALMFVFIISLLWSQAKKNVWNWIYPVLIGLNLIALFYTGTRGAQIGLLVGVAITLLVEAFYEKGRYRTMTVGVLVVTAILVSSVFVFKNSQFVQSSPSLARFASISPNEITGMSRISIWKISYEAWKEKPILGYGQDNFTHIYASKFIPDKMWMLESWYDRSHDVFFDWLVAAGILGLISYLSLYVVALYLMWYKKNDMPIREKAILTGLMAGYFIHNIFVFDNLVSYFTFFAVLAYIALRTNARGAVLTGKKVSDDQMNYIYTPVAVIAFAMVFYFVTFIPIRINHLLVKGLDINRLVQTMTFADAVKVQQNSFQQAIAYHSLGSIEAQEQFMQTIGRMVQVTIPQDTPADVRANVTAALNGLAQAGRDDVTRSYEKNSDNVRMLTLYGMFYSGIGDAASAEKILVHAHELAPKKQLVSFELIRTYLVERKMDEAYTLARTTYDLAPVYPDARKVYMISGVYDNKWDEVVSHLAQNNQKVEFDSDVIGALVQMGQSKVAIALLEQEKQGHPEYTSQIDAYVKQLLAQPAK